jgi:tyrosyl-tRNA synthetase
MRIQCSPALTPREQAKIKKAFCPPGVADANPCLQYIRLVTLPWSGEFKLCRPADCGGDKARQALCQTSQGLNTAHSVTPTTRLSRLIIPLARCILVI